MAKILVSMSDDFLNRIDCIASQEQRTRSELIREALRSYIRRSNIINPEKAQHNAQILEQILS